jgi:hypothetical protein
MTVSAGPESPQHAAAWLVRAQVHHSVLLSAVLGLAALSGFCGNPGAWAVRIKVGGMPPPA